MHFTLLSTGSFGAQVLHKLITKPDLVVTSPDTFGGRGLKNRIINPVKKLAQKLKIPVQELKKLDHKTSNLLSHTNSVVVVVDFGLIIPASFINTCTFGVWNIHPSLLPRYRGPTPIQSVLVNGEKETGVSIIKIDAQIDHGPLLSLQNGAPALQTTAISENDTNLTLTKTLSQIGASLLDELLKDPQNSTLSIHKQNHDKATFTKRFEKKDGYVPFEDLSPLLFELFKKYNLSHYIYPKVTSAPFCATHKAYALHNKIRALAPWPGVFSELPNGKHIKVLASMKKGVTIHISRVQIEGKIYEN